MTRLFLGAFEKTSDMSHSAERPARPTRPVLPSLSCRTLHHPSFLPLYVTAHFGRQHADWSDQAAPPIIPAEFYYTDPSMAPGRRIHNAVTELRVLECFQLNTPPPVMTARPATSNRPDPFGSGPHLTRDLGSAAWSAPPCCCRVHPSHVVVQLTQEEDQAVTNLLKLHHQGPLLETVNVDYNGAVGPHRDLDSRLFYQRPQRPLCSDVQHGICWSETELEAANTLLGRFVPLQEDKLRDHCHHESVETHPDPRQLSLLELKRGSEAVAASATSPPTQSDIGFSCLRQREEPGRQDGASAGDGLASRGLPEVRGQTRSDSEGEAAHVLLSLWDLGSADIVQ